MSVLRLVFLGALICVLGACASTLPANYQLPQPKQAVDSEKPLNPLGDVTLSTYLAENVISSVDKLSLFSIDSWTPLDNKHLILWTSPQRPFLLSLQRHCQDLRFAEAISLTNNTSTLHARFDAVIVQDGFFSKMPCYIEEIHPLNKAQALEVQRLSRR